MALNDEAFYNVFGEKITREYLVDQSVGYYKLKEEAGETEVNDFSEGSEIRTLIESWAVDVYIMMFLENEVTKQAFIDTATGEWLDKIGMQPFVKLARNKGTVAKGTVTFSLPSNAVSDYIIPMGTIVVSKDTGLYYQTTGECLIATGTSSESVPCECLTVGSDGNCESGSITIINDSYVTDNNLSVSNSSAFEDGTDYEEDWLYRERLLEFVRADDFGSLPYYTKLAESVPGVHDVLFVDATGYTQKIIVNGDVKPTPDTVLLDVLAKFSDTGNCVLKHSFTVGRPDYVTVDLTVNLGVVNEMSESVITNILTDFFNGGSHEEGFELGGVNIGQDVTKEDLYALFSIIDNIISVQITSGGTEITTLEVDNDEVLKLGTLTINQTVVS